MAATATKEMATTEAPRHKPHEQLPSIAPPRLPYHPAIEQRFGVDKAAWKALVEAIFPNATSTESVILALSYCRARKLDPFKRCVHIVPIWNKDLRRYVDTIWPGIGELRTTAFRTSEYAGRDDARFGDDETREFRGMVGKRGQEREVSKTVTFPQWSQITVYRIVKGQRVAFAGPKVYWLETYATLGYDNEVPNDMWESRPRGQIEKCFDSETEVLTDHGFQPFGFVTGRILQVSEGGLEPTDAEPFSQKYIGQMIGCDGNALNFCVTPNHDMVTTGGKIEAIKLFEGSTSSAGYTIPLTLQSRQSKPDAAYSDKQLTLAAAIVCDGYKHASGFAIAVSRDEKVERLESLLMHSGRHIRRSAGDTAFVAGRKIVTRRDKAVFQYARQVAGNLLADSGDLVTSEILTLSRRQSRLLVDAMLSFDGSASKTARRFYSSSPQILGAFELAACIAGYSVSRRRERQGDIGGPNWCVTVSTKEQSKTFRASGSQKGKLKGGLTQQENSDGYVWCCRVPSGVIVVRRHGLSMLCGNCAEAAALRAAFPEEVGGDYIPEEVERGGGRQPVTVEGSATPSKQLEELADQLLGANGEMAPDPKPAEEDTDEAQAESQTQAQPEGDPQLREWATVELGGVTTISDVESIRAAAKRKVTTEADAKMVAALCDSRANAIREAKKQESAK